MSNLNQEIQKRRTFAIISHPDAGKTDLAISAKHFDRTAVIVQTRATQFEHGAVEGLDRTVVHDESVAEDDVLRATIERNGTGIDE